MTLLGQGVHSLQAPSFLRLPHSVTSLTIVADTVTLVHVRDIMAQLPNLDDLSLSGSLVAVDRRSSPGIETVPRGRFGGKLRLIQGYADESVVNMLLEVPTGLHFTEVDIRGIHECLLSTVRLAEACGKTLVKLSYAVSFQYGREASEQSFDFSKFPNLQEVDFGVRWMGGGLLWIPVALSTLKPATSPHLSTIQLSFIHPPTNQSIQATIEGAGSDLRSVAGEVARIEREFDGAVGLTVLRDPEFKVVFDTLNILLHSALIPLTSTYRILHTYTR